LSASETQERHRHLNLPSRISLALNPGYA